MGTYPADLVTADICLVGRCFVQLALETAVIWPWEVLSRRYSIHPRGGKTYVQKKGIPCSETFIAATSGLLAIRKTAVTLRGSVTALEYCSAVKRKAHLTAL